MAQGDNIIIDVLGNTRPLEKQIQKVANTALVLNSKGFSQPLGRINGQLGEFEKSLAASNARVIAFGASAGAIFAVERAFSETIRSVINVEKALTDINVILNVSQKNLSSFGDSLFNVAKNTGQSFDQVASAATEFARQGLGLEETLKRTSDALILTRLTGLNVVDSVESITAALNSFNKTTITSNELINKLAAVDAAFAVSSADLAEAIKRVGSSAQDVGVDLNQLIALVTSAQQTTARGGAVIGNSFKTIFTRLQRTDTLDALEAIGVATKDQEGNILPLITILNSLSRTYSTLGDSQRAQIAELVGGVFQINILKAALADLGNEYSIYSRAVQISNGATNEANSRNAELNQTLSATVNQTLVNLQKLAAEVGNITLAPTLKNLLGGINNLLEGFDPKDSEDFGSRIGQGLLKGLGSFISGPGVLLAAAALFKIFERLVVFSADAFKSLTGLNSKIAEQQALQNQVLNLISKNPQIIQQINNGTANTASLHKQILALIEQETAAMQRQLSIASTISKSLMSSGVRISQTGATKGMPVKASGFIPNFSAQQEIAGAIQGGYQPGKIRQMNIPDYGMVTYNSAEKVKKFVGFNQPAIMPPEQSKAGKKYKNNFEKTHGFDPYSYDGFIPNFVLPSAPAGALTNLKGAQIATLAKGGSINLPLGQKYTPNEEQRLYYAQLQQSRRRPESQNKRSKPVISAIGEEFSILSIANSDFDQIAGKELAKAIQSIAFKLIQPSTKKLPKASSILDQLQKDTSAYPQILGRLFESSINAAISLDLSKKAGGGGGVWDYSGGNFAQDKVNQSLFGGQLAAMQALPYLDAKLNAGSRDTYESVKGKIKNTSSLKNALMTAAKNNEKMVKLPYGIIKSKGNVKPIIFREDDLNASQGFIPNFAALKEAMAREISAGVPASTVRVGKSKDLVSNKNPLGLGVYNTEDEPLGLNQGINRFSSKKEARNAGANRGYIPNFVMTGRNQYGTPYSPNFPAGGKSLGIDEALSSVSKSLTSSLKKLKDVSLITTTQIKELGAKSKNIKTVFDDNQLPESIQKYKGSLIQASIGLSLASGLLSEATKNSPRLSQAIESFSSTLTLASTAMQIIPGKAGVFGAALLGLTGTFGTIAGILKDKSTDLANKAEEAGQTLTDFSNSSQRYAEVLQKLEEANKDPKTSVDTLNKLNEDLVKAAQEIPSAYREQLVSITNYTELLDEISRVQAKLAQESEGAKSTSEFASILDKRTGSASARVFEALSGKAIFNPDESIGGGVGGLFLKPGEVEKIAKQVATSGFSDLSKRGDLLSRIRESGQFGAVDIQRAASSPRYLESLGFNRDFSSQIERLTSQGEQGQVEAENLIQSVLNKLSEEILGQEQFEKTKAAREQELELMRKDREEKQRSIELEKSRQSALDLFYQKLIEIGNVEAEMRDKSAFDTADIQLQRASGLLDLQRGSMGGQAQREYQYAIDSAKKQLEFAQRYREQESQARQNVLQEGYKIFLDLKKLNVEGEPAKIDPQLLNLFQKELGALAVSGKSANEVGLEINKAFKGYFGSTQYGNKAIDLQSQTNSILGDNQRALSSLLLEQKKQTEISKNNNEIQKAAIQRQKDVRAFGGIESYLTPESNQTVDSLVTNIRGLGTPVEGRASTGVLLDTVKMFGGSLEGMNLGSLKERAIAGRAEDIRFQTSAISRLLTSKGEVGLAQEYTKIGGRANEIARTQIEEAIQDQQALRNIDTNVSSITSSVGSILGALGGSTEGASQSANQSSSLVSNIQNLNLGAQFEPLINSLTSFNTNFSSNIGNLNNLVPQITSQANNQSNQNVSKSIELKNTELALNGNVAVNINSEPLQFTLDTASVENIREDISSQIEVSLSELRQQIESEMKTLESNVNQRIVALGGQRLPPTNR